MEQACALLLVSARTVNKCPFCGLFSAMLFIFFYFSLLKMALECSVEVLSSDLNAGSLFCAIWRKCMLNKLCSGMSRSAVDCEFNVNESTVYIK